MTRCSFPYRRICVIGTTGSGKSALAKRIACRLDLAYIELDALHWESGWTEVPPDIFRQRVEGVTSSPAWVVDGNYHAVRDITWQRAEAVVWLDYPFSVILWRLWWRTWKRAVTHEVLWNGNRESLWLHFFTKDSLFLWMFQTYHLRKREYPLLIAMPEHAHLKIIHLTSPAQTGKWIDTL